MSTRRQFLQHTTHGALGLLLASTLGSSDADAEGEALVAHARSIIVLWMNGGPSHIDTFDPKQGNGPFKAIKTRAPGVEICEHLPRLADQADKLAIVRSMTSKEGNHDRARYLAHTGYAPNPTVAHPSLGAWLSRGGGGALPRFVSIGGPSAGGGFLGVDHAPFVVRRGGDRPANVDHGFGVDAQRFARRAGALEFLEQRFAARTGSAAVKARREVYARAQQMMRAKDLDAFDSSSEPKSTIEAYGDSDFGRGCLVARRLVEAGVRVVEVTQDGWDTHDDGFERSRTLMGELDPAMATLLSDLAERDLLDTTLVLWMGEFGRSAYINAREGRDHHPRAWSAVLAGGGVRGGIVHGATDARGEAVAEQPVKVPDLFATVAWQLGVDPSETATSSGGRPIAVTDGGSVIRSLLASG
jgi:hypothetical protein